MRLILDFQSDLDRKMTLGPSVIARKNEENIREAEKRLDAAESDGTVDPADRASMLLRLFKMTFGSVTLFEQNENVLLPQLCRIITVCMHSATCAQAPQNYLYLLRALFRSIGGGKFELLYKELLRVLPGLLKGLVALQRSVETNSDPTTKKLLIELCLTVPARLPSLLKHLPLLMTPIILALRSPHQELIMLSLRTVEFWLDNLNIKFLYPILTSASIENDLMNALTNLLRPSPMVYGEVAMRVLGKLGGRNRRFLVKPQPQKMQHHAYSGLEARFYWGPSLGNSAENLSLDKFIELSSAFLERHYRRGGQSTADGQPLRYVQGRVEEYA